MKLVVTVADACHLVHAGGEVVRDSAIIEIPDESLPSLVKEYLSLKKQPNAYVSISFSLLVEPTEWFGPIPGPDDAQIPQPSELEKLRDEMPCCRAIDINWNHQYAPRQWHIWADSSDDLAVNGQGATLSDAIAEARKQLAAKQKE